MTDPTDPGPTDPGPTDPGPTDPGYDTPDHLRATEDRLRAALDARARSLDPDPYSLPRIEEKLMSTAPSRTRWYALGGVAAVVLLVVGLVALGGDDDPEVTADDPTTSSTSATTEPETPPSSDTTSTTTFAPTTDASIVVFPAIDSSQRFDDPRSAAFAFATQYAGFTDPVLSEFREGDSRSGEFEVTRNGSGPVSTILVRQLDDDTWGVIGAVHDGITPEKPEDDDLVTSPIELAGFGLAFEGTINVDVREQGRTTSIGEGFVTAGGSPPGDSYQDELAFSTPETEFGAIMYREFSAEDGTTSWVSITRVRFAGATTETACGPSQNEAGDGVLVFFSCTRATDNPPEVVAVRRAGSGDAGVLRAAMTALLEGPTDDEAARGIESPFPIPGDGMTVRGLDVTDGLATIDLTVDRADLLAGGDTLYGMTLIQQIQLTAQQFPTVDRVRVLFNGSCDEFGEWSQAGPGNCDL